MARRLAQREGCDVHPRRRRRGAHKIGDRPLEVGKVRVFEESFDSYYPHDDMRPLSRLEENLPHRTP